MADAPNPLDALFGAVLPPGAAVPDGMADLHYAIDDIPDAVANPCLGWDNRAVDLAMTAEQNYGSILSAIPEGNLGAEVTIAHNDLFVNPDTSVQMRVAYTLSCALMTARDSYDSDKVMAQYAYQVYSLIDSESKRASVDEWKKAIKSAAAVLLSNTNRVINVDYRGVDAAWITKTADVVGPPAAANAWIIGLPGSGAFVGTGGAQINLRASALPIEDIAVETLPLGIAVAVVLFFSDNIVKFREKAMGALVHTIISVGKGGNITHDKLNRIIREIQTKTGVDLDPEPHLVPMIWQALGSQITADTAGDVIARLYQSVGDDENRLRLRIILQQSLGTNLTCVTLVAKAMREHSTFPWSQVVKAFPAEAAALNLALTTIRNNPYYGFGRGLDQVGSRRYKSITWVAKELLVKVSGESSLLQYAGLPRVVPQQESLERMITEYQRRRANSIMEVADWDDQQQAADLLALARASGNLA